MTIRHLPATGYVTRPWKNGTGVTDEICLLPETATRDAFDLRISRATIAGPGLFSAFPGADRTITPIEGEGLVLDFGGREVRLARWQPHTFDTGQTPDGRPEGGIVRVFNVMALRGRWRLAPAQVVRGPSNTSPAKGGMTVVFALCGGWRLNDADGTALLAEGDTALLDGPAHMVADAAGAAALIVPLVPVP